MRDVGKAGAVARQPPMPRGRATHESRLCEMLISLRLPSRLHRQDAAARSVVEDRTEGTAGTVMQAFVQFFGSQIRYRGHRDAHHFSGSGQLAALLFRSMESITEPCFSISSSNLRRSLSNTQCLELNDACDDTCRALPVSGHDCTEVVIANSDLEAGLTFQSCLTGGQAGLAQWKSAHPIFRSGDWQYRMAGLSGAKAKI
jgi:hypothetical protein